MQAAIEFSCSFALFIINILSMSGFERGPFAYYKIKPPNYHDISTRTVTDAPSKCLGAWCLCGWLAVCTLTLNGTCETTDFWEQGRSDTAGWLSLSELVWHSGSWAVSRWRWVTRCWVLYLWSFLSWPFSPHWGLGLRPAPSSSEKWAKLYWWRNSVFNWHGIAKFFVDVNTIINEYGIRSVS